MLAHILKGHDITELYSPPRVTEMAVRIGLSAGFAMDLTTVDDQGRPWDFSQEECRSRAKAAIAASKPLLVIGSPMCTAYSVMQNLNPWTDQAAEARKAADGHMKFICEVYRQQVE